MPDRKTEIFAAYGDNVADALRNWQQIDPTGYEVWHTRLADRMYLSEYRRWAARQKVSVTAPSEATGTERLFQVPAGEALRTRSTVVHDGRERTLLELAGSEGAATLRQAALRDLNRAESTSRRCKLHLRLAELIEAESQRQGRPVAVAEVVGMVAA